ncbi:unnamed protein product [Caenorhabditis bovis]|uniref:Receptor L-domain domain-containing protein n=1 Tax=Caenorhabditis bovis TaxID=2654633 RepID=A0A8S1E983_9PELO|nr:unnamed protein product [Caenorhabditis bovis]
MLLLRALLISLFGLFIEGQEYISDFYYIGLQFECDPQCWFNESVVTTKTLNKFPVECATVCGKMMFTSESDVSIYEATPYFKNLTRLNGALLFDRTLYKSFEFLANLEEVHCEQLYGIFSITNNEHLQHLGLDKLKMVTCMITIYENQHLTDLPCDLISASGGAADGNLENCKECALGSINIDSIRKPENCTTGTLGIYLRDVFYWSGTDMSAFSQLENLTGSLEVFSTDVPNLGFLNNLKRIRSGDLIISECRNMTSLGLVPLVEFVPFSENRRASISISTVHSEFCLTVGEMETFLSSGVKFNNVEAKPCINDSRIDNINICVYESMKTFKSSCSHLIGNILINSENEDDVEVLKNVKMIFGQITINDTKLKSLEFLKNLEFVALLNDSRPAVIVSHNSVIEDMTFKNLKRAFSFGKYHIEYEENMGLAMKSDTCPEFRDRLTDTAIKLNGFECEVLSRFDTIDEKLSTTINFMSSIIIICFTLFIIP